MPHAYLCVLRNPGPQQELLLAQKNIYLPPHGRYQYASIARNALQYVIPGGRILSGEGAPDAAAREFFEDTGVRLSTASLVPLYTEGEHSFFQVRQPSGVDVAAINVALTGRTAPSAKTNHMTWAPLDVAHCWLGHRSNQKTWPAWVTTQIQRALQAGFAQDLISQRIHESHALMTRAVAHLIISNAPASSDPLPPFAPSATG